MAKHIFKLQKFIFVILICISTTGCGDKPQPVTSKNAGAGINVLLITIDTLRSDHLSTYGYPRATSPNIDNLAATGVVFEQAFTYWPKTRGSFAAIFTGLYAAQHGLTVRERDLPAFNQTMAETFSEAGFRTAAAIDNGNLDAALGFSQGFDSYEQTWLSQGNELDRTEAITKFAEHYFTEEEDTPFFLWLHYVNPHAPYEPPAKQLAKFRGDGLVPRGPKLSPVTGYHGGINKKHVAVEGEFHWGDYVDRYDAEISVSDEHVGRVMNALETTGQKKNTLVILTSDHGESLGEHDYFFDHGNYLFNPSLRIPLILSLPGILPSGKRESSVVSSLDIFPTVLDLSQVSYPPGLSGKSVLPVIRGTKSRLHNQIFFQNDQHLFAITNGRLKVIRNPKNDTFFLYDMYQDPTEKENRYYGSESVIAPLQAELQSFQTQTVAWQQITSRKRAEGQNSSLPDSKLNEKTLDVLRHLGYIEN